jgi:hypothetical protein
MFLINTLHGKPHVIALDKENRKWGQIWVNVVAAAVETTEEGQEWICGSAIRFRILILLDG